MNERGEMAEAERAEAERRARVREGGESNWGAPRRGDSGGESGSGPFEQGGGKGYEVAQDAFRVMTAGYAEARLDGWYRRLWRPERWLHERRTRANDGSTNGGRARTNV